MTPEEAGKILAVSPFWRKMKEKEKKNCLLEYCVNFNNTTTTSN